MKNIDNLILEKIMSCDKPVTSKQIEHSLGISGMDVRAAVNRLRRKGQPVGSGEKGYFICKTTGDVDRVINQLSSRVQGITNAILGLHKVKRELELQTEK